MVGGWIGWFTDSKLANIVDYMQSIAANHSLQPIDQDYPPLQLCVSSSLCQSVTSKTWNPAVDW